MKCASKINVFMFFDYRDYLRAFFNELKKNDLDFSLRTLQESLTFSGSAFFSRILDGSRPFSLEKARQFADYYTFPEKEKEYLLSMVRFGNEKNVDKRDVLLKALVSLRSNHKEYALQDASLKFFSKWYIPVLRDLMPLILTETNYNQIGRMFVPPLKETQVKSALAYLIENKFLFKSDDGLFEVREPIVSTPPRVRSTILRQYHLKNLEINADAYDLCSVDERSLSSITCSLSPESFEKVREEIRLLRERVLAIAQEDKNPSMVCHLGVQWLPRAKKRRDK